MGLRISAALASATLLVAVPGQAGAATTLGQLDPAGAPSGSCLGVTGWVQSAESGSPSYVVPAGSWVVTSWSHKANAAAGRQLGFRVWRPTAVAGSYVLAGGSGLEILTPSTVNTFATRVPVQPGDIIGLRVGNPPVLPDFIGGGASCAFTSTAGNTIRFGLASTEPSQGETASLPASLTSNRLNVTARLEADVDGDGFGDETQDGCPSSAVDSGPCSAPTAPPPAGAAPDRTAPRVRLSSRKRESVRDRRVTVFVYSSEPVTLTTTARVSVPGAARALRLRKTARKVAANTRVALKLRMSKKTRRMIRRGLARRKKLVARVTVRARDEADNVSTAKRKVRLKR